ncbi:MAG: P-loop ATPase, Sll1717 family [Chlorobiota bacterium]
MIQNLPKQITFYDLQEFSFGDIEAKDDDLLIDSVCRTSAILEFLVGKKNIVLGEKGTGKTAIFRLLREGKLYFKNKNCFKNILIPVDDNFQYKNIKGKILKLIETDNEDVGFKYQVVWELFLFYKIIQELDKLNISLTRELTEAKELFDTVLSKSSLDRFLKNKSTFTVKLYNSDMYVMPEASYTTEPVKLNDNIEGKSVKKLEIDLDKYKRAANDFIKENNYNIIVLIDRLDEFVSKSSIPIQLELLQSLISVEREYGSYDNIDIKLFLRNDLFEQLSFENIGGFDKVISKKVDLKWSEDNIREFIAKRILSNYKKVFKLDNLGVTVDSHNLKIDTTLDNQSNKKPNIFGKLYRNFIAKFKPELYEQKFPREVSLDDDINKQLIQTLLPKHVCYKNEEGQIETISVFDFFAENFNLGTGNSIPRLILLFLERLISVTSEYYLKNSDLLPIKLTDQNNFELIKEGFFEEAYSLFKDDIYLNISKLNPEFEKSILTFKERIGNKYSFRAKELKNIVNITDDEELYNFCSYMVHIGFFKRTNTLATIDRMKFELPPMFRRINNK